MVRSNKWAGVLSAAVALAVPTVALAGGGGQNMLLIVDPNNESALRIANAYAELRAIPESNIIFIEPQKRLGYTAREAINTDVRTRYVNVLPGIMQDRGISGQVDYIGTLGQPQSIGGTYRNASNVSISTKLSFNYALAQLTQLERGMAFGSAYGASNYDAGITYRNSELLQVRPTSGASGTFNYTPGSNGAIQHSQQKSAISTAPPGYNYLQWYMSGNVGNTGSHAMNTEQVIANLERSAGSDGTKPEGRYYFMDSGDALRTGTRKNFWPAVQNYMTANGIPWVEQSGVTGNSPRNVTDVRGAVLGAANPAVPNGSTYLPGSWVDNMTSSGSSYSSSAHTKTNRALVAGAGGTSGTITEPYAIQDRFTFSSVFVYHNDGSTLGEAFFKATAKPDVQMFEGDMLAQPYADVPQVSLTSILPANSVVSGSINIGASAVLPPSPKYATGIGKLQLFVNGKAGQVINAGSGTFNLDTTQLSDGVHELRVVAYNNAAAQSQGFVRTNVVVNNLGRSLSSVEGTVAATWNQQLSVPVTAAGPGAVTAVELRSLGRVVGQIGSASGQVVLDSTKLAFGRNTIVPVAIFADGSEVRGQSFAVERDFRKLAGKPLSDPLDRTAGFAYEFFASAAGNTIDSSDLTGPPSHAFQAPTVELDATDGTNVPDAYRYGQGGSPAGLVVRISSRMQVATEGEYSFWFGTGMRWSSLDLSIDGVEVSAFEHWNGATFDSQAIQQWGADTTRSAYLMPGEHELTFTLASFAGTSSDTYTSIDLWYRGPDGINARPGTGTQSSGASFYTVIPEPASAALLGLGGLGLLRRRRR